MHLQGTHWLGLCKHNTVLYDVHMRPRFFSEPTTAPLQHSMRQQLQCSRVAVFTWAERKLTRYPALEGYLAMLYSYTSAHSEKPGIESESDSVRSIRFSVWGVLRSWGGLARRLLGHPPQKYGKPDRPTAAHCTGRRLLRSGVTEIRCHRGHSITLQACCQSRQ